MKVKLIECPRDAMQGLDTFVATDLKVRYINALLQVGFETLDCGSFVNPGVIPQMADTAEVIKRIKMTETKLSVIVANTRGAASAVEFDEISYLGFPFSISEMFQKRNTNKSIDDAFETVERIMELCTKHNKKFIAYLSMGFGNPYNDPWSPETVIHWIKKLKSIGVNFFSLSDTIGVSNPERIESVIGKIKQELPNLNYGCHFHTRPDQWLEKIETAFNAGCRRFDGALKGFGGCPMAEDELVGNMPTENMVAWFKSQNIETGLNMDRFNEAMLLASEVFSNT